MKISLKSIPFVVVDLYSGSFTKSEKGHEIFNLTKNSVTNRYYGYCPPLDSINIRALGARKNDEFVSHIMIIYVKKQGKSNDRKIIAFCDDAIAYHPHQIDHALNRRISTSNKDGEDFSYSIESEYMYNLEHVQKPFIIPIHEYSRSMFRSQKFYKGKYPKLDIEIIDYLERYLNLLNSDDDFDFQREVQNIDLKDFHESMDYSSKMPTYTKGRNGRQVEKKSSISKAALIRAHYICEGDEKHITFTTSRGNPYMEGHHLIPCTYGNSEDYWNKYGVNIDCVENIVCLCPTCHRLVHFGSEKERNKLLEKLYLKQISKLKSVNLDISLEELLERYKM